MANEFKEIQANLKQTDDNLKRFAEQAQAAQKENKELAADIKAQVDELLMVQATLKKRIQDAEQRLAEGVVSTPAEALTLVEKIEKDEAFKNSFERVKKMGGKANVTIQNVSIGDKVIRPSRKSEIIAAPQRELFLRDIINFQKIGEAAAVDYVEEYGFINRAAVAKEGTQKPRSNISYRTKLAPIETIAHWMRTSKQSLADFKSLMERISVSLSYGLKLVEEQQLLLGSGQDNNIKGIMQFAQDFNDEDYTIAKYQALDKLRLALLQVQLAEYPADAIVIHPVDYATKIELLKNELGNYIVGDPNSKGFKTLWGLPVVETQSIGLGNFLVGAFRLGCTGYDREEINIEVATQDEDNFTKNMVTIRCEERVGLSVERPEAFVTGNISDAASTVTGTATGAATGTATGAATGTSSATQTA